MRHNIATYLQWFELNYLHVHRFWSFSSSCPIRKFRCNQPSYLSTKGMNPEFEAYWKTPSFSNDKKLVFQPAERNKLSILKTMQQYIDASATGKLLEISSGSGQHVAHISHEFPNIVFQPSDIEEHFLSSIKEYIRDGNLLNVRQPLHLNVDTLAQFWGNELLKGESFDFILAINLLHVAPSSCSEGLFKGCSTVLKPGGLIFVYGAFSEDGVIRPESNVQFDINLKEQNPTWGIRDVHKELIPLASKLGIDLLMIHDLPSNNKMLVWKKQAIQRD